jgi:hypothetical protein
VVRPAGTEKVVEEARRLALVRHASASFKYLSLSDISSHEQVSSSPFSFFFLQ